MFNNIIPSIFNGIFGQEASSTPEYLQLLGVSKVQDLPDYEKLNSDENLVKLLESTVDESS